MLPGDRHVVTFDLPDVSAGGVMLGDWLDAFAENGVGWTDLVAERAP